ncbi:MAG: helix-turn-helix transcriptional regulator [Alphaproteobacteria bacterium]
MDVRTVCLGILSRDSATGYEIQKALKEGWPSLFFEASYGSIYPALAKLTDDGLVTCKEEVAVGRPDRKVYSITDSGRQFFSQALLAPIAPDKYRSDFLAMIYFSDSLPPALLQKYLDERLLTHKAELGLIDDLCSGEQSPGEAFLMEWGRQMNQLCIDFITNHRGALEEAVGEQLSEAAE